MGGGRRSAPCCQGLLAQGGPGPKRVAAMRRLPERRGGGRARLRPRAAASAPHGGLRAPGYGVSPTRRERVRSGAAVPPPGAWPRSVIQPRSPSLPALSPPRNVVPSAERPKCCFRSSRAAGCCIQNVNASGVFLVCMYVCAYHSLGQIRWLP